MVALGVVSGSIWGGLGAGVAAAESGRAYELVSPPDKGGQAVFFAPRGLGMGIVRPSIDGNALVYPSWGTFADARRGMPSTYRSRRTPDGWHTSAVSPPPTTPNPDAVSNRFVNTWRDAADDLSSGLSVTADPLDAIDVNRAIDLYGTSSDGTVSLLSRGNGSSLIDPGYAAVYSREDGTGALSPDGRHAIFSTEAHLVPEDADRAEGADLYERFEGKTYLVNQSDAGGTVVNKCGSSFAAVSRAISSDGERVIFQSPPLGIFFGFDPDCWRPKEIFMRVGRARTIQISQSQRTPVAATPADKFFRGSSLDGDKVYFTSSEELTDRPGNGLYRYTVSTGRLDLVVSATSGVYVTKVSADGSTVYFVASDALAPGAELGVDNLYYVRGDGSPTFVAKTSSFDGFLSTIRSDYEGPRQANVTPDGRRLLFVASKVDGEEFETNGRAQVYLYDIDGARLTCLSCDPAGQRPAGSVARTDAAVKALLETNDDQAPAITADGRTVVFDTGDQLVAGDTNGRRDVYEYRDGRLSLVTTGRDRNDSALIGMAGNGRDVFFATSASLVAADIDGGNVDVYDARLGGGFPDEVEPSVQRCDGDGCQGAAQRTPQFGDVGTQTFSGDGQIDEPEPQLAPDKALAVRRLSRIDKKRFATTGRLRLTVRVQGGGTVRVRGTAKINRRVRSVAKASRRINATRKLNARIVVRLNRAGKRTLAKQGKLRVRLVVRLAGLPQHRTLSITLSRKRA